jgi:hypothetical protein
MKLILLSPRENEVYVKVDDDWYEELKRYNWSLSGVGYAQRSALKSKGEKGAYIYMHRIINKTPDGFDTDHIDRDRLNNQSANLRSVTRGVGNQNRNAYNELGVKGVYKFRGKFRASIRFSGKVYYLGTFETVDDAGQAYADAAKKYYGENNV